MEGNPILSSSDDSLTKAKFTPQQIHAIETSLNLVLRAGAGSGKTTVLVERYIHLLRVNPDWRLSHIVAITFTRAAAAEMRIRIRERLVQMQTQDDPPLRNWADLIREMDSARVSTIHGLCSDLLKVNAAYIGLDPDFIVMETYQSDILLEQSARNVLDQIALQNDWADFFQAYSYATILSTLAKPALMAAQLDLETDERDIQSFKQHFMEVYQSQQDANLQQSSYSTFLDSLKDFLKETPCLENDGLTSALQPIRDLLLTDPTAFEILFSVSNINLNGKGRAGDWKKQSFDINIIREDWGQLKEHADHLLKILPSPPSPFLGNWYYLIQQTQSQYQYRKRLQSYLDFDDLERLTAQLLGENEAVRQRYQNTEIKYLMVDEFQDTNARQWQIISNLVDVNTQNTLFVVGDPKQSIYQFRGADVTVFDAVSQLITTSGGETVPLNRSFRTHKLLVDQFNGLFTNLMSNPEALPFEITWDENDTMDAQRKQAPGSASHYLELLLIQRPESTPTDNFSADQWEAYEIAQRLSHLAEQPIYLDKGQPATFGDIVILFRTTSVIKIFEDMFNEHGLPYITIGGRSFYQQQEIWDLISLLETLHNPLDDLALATILRSPMFAFSDDLLLALRIPEPGQSLPTPLWQRLQNVVLDSLDLLIPNQSFTYQCSPFESQQIHFAWQTLSQLHHEEGRVSIGNLLRMALERIPYLATLTLLPNGLKMRRNVEKLIEIAENSDYISLGDFTRFLKHVQDKEFREGQATLDTLDAVQFMTAHGSKGLEFPIVIIPNADSTLKANADNLIYNENKGLAANYPLVEKGIENAHIQQLKDYLKLKEQAELKRLLYVAMTRAKDYLIISANLKRNNNGQLSGNNHWFKYICDNLPLQTPIDWNLPDQQINLASSSIRIQIKQPQPDESPSLNGATSSDLTFPDLGTPAPLTTLPLLAAITPTVDNALIHLSASKLEWLGAYYLNPQAPASHRYLRAFLSDLLPYETDHVDSVFISQRDSQLIGRVVHRMLEFWHLPHANRDIVPVLRSYLWEEGLSNPDQLEKLTAACLRILQDFTASATYHWIMSIPEEQRFVELPFIYRKNNIILHGIIDLLLQDQQGNWHIIDYKTGDVAGMDLQRYTSRYHLQLGAYASAMAEKLNHMPQTHIYYVSQDQLITVPTERWLPDFNQLENHLQGLTRQYV